MNIPFLKNLITEQGTKIYIYFAVRAYSEDYDPYNKNVDYINLNPHVIMGYVQMISPEKLVWKQYGLQEMGAVEVLCEARYKDWFKTCSRIVINGDDYSVFKVGGGKRVLIQDRPGNMIRVVLEKKG